MTSRTASSRFGALVTATLTSLTLVGCHHAPTQLDWDTVDTLMAQQFPNVPTITSDTLAEQLENPDADLILLDVREVDEFGVSHLREARHIGADIEAASQLAARSPETLLVAYCSVGYRSAALVAALQERGHSNAVNLEGSIFKWVSEGRPVFRGDRQVDRVHPYDERWGTLLPEHFWAWQPD